MLIDTETMLYLFSHIENTHLNTNVLFLHLDPYIHLRESHTHVKVMTKFLDMSLYLEPHQKFIQKISIPSFAECVL